MKVCNARSARNEIKAYNHINTFKTDHGGQTLVRKLEDSFEVTSDWGNFSCLVHKPLSISLRQLRSKCLNRRMALYLLRPTLIHILLALDFLHSHAHMVHTGQSSYIQCAITVKFSDRTRLTGKEHHTWPRGPISPGRI